MSDFSKVEVVPGNKMLEKVLSTMLKADQLEDAPPLLKSLIRKYFMTGAGIVAGSIELAIAEATGKVLVETIEPFKKEAQGSGLCMSTVKVPIGASEKDVQDLADMHFSKDKD